MSTCLLSACARALSGFRLTPVARSPPAMTVAIIIPSHTQPSLFLTLACARTNKLNPNKFRHPLAAKYYDMATQLRPEFTDPGRSVSAAKMGTRVKKIVLYYLIRKLSPICNSDSAI